MSTNLRVCLLLFFCVCLFFGVCVFFFFLVFFFCILMNDRRIGLRDKLGRMGKNKVNSKKVIYQSSVFTDQRSKTRI